MELEIIQVIQELSTKAAPNASHGSWLAPSVAPASRTKRREHGRRTGRRRYEDLTDRGLALAHPHARTAAAPRPRHRHSVLYDRGDVRAWRRPRHSGAQPWRQFDGRCGRGACDQRGKPFTKATRRQLAVDPEPAASMGLVERFGCSADCATKCSSRCRRASRRTFSASKGARVAHLASFRMESTSNVFSPTRLQARRSARSSEFRMTQS